MRYAIACLQHPALHMKHDYYYTGNEWAGYPPLWSWRRDVALTFSEHFIAEEWMKKLIDQGITTNDGEIIDGTVYALYLKEV